MNTNFWLKIGLLPQCAILTLNKIPRWIYRKSGISRGIVTPNTGQNATLEIPNFLMAEIFNLNLILLGFYWKTVLVEHWNGTEEAGGKNFLGRGELLGFQRWLAKLARLFSKRYIDLESQFCVAHSLTPTNKTKQQVTGPPQAKSFSCWSQAMECR